MRSGLHENDDRDEEDPRRQHRHRGELAKLAVPLQERGRRVGSQGEHAEERQPAEDPDCLGTVGGVDVDEPDEHRRQPVCEQGAHDPEPDEHEQRGEQQAWASARLSRVAWIVKKRASDAEMPPSSEVSVLRAISASDQTPKRSGPSRLTSTGVTEQRREDRRDLGEPVEAHPRAEAARAEEGEPVRT